MNPEDIDVKKLPRMHNLRTMPAAAIDDSELNLAIIDVMEARDLLIESRTALDEGVPKFLSFKPTYGENPADWARIIREKLCIDTDKQYSFQSSRQFYLYIRRKVEDAGIFVQGFSGVDVTMVRGFAIFDEIMPIIGINDNDRYPAKSFSLIHELVHIIKRSSAVCNDMDASSNAYKEEIFCNAVAGEFLVPKPNLLKQLGAYTSEEIDLEVIERLAKKFSVSKEVVTRRLLDFHKISKVRYDRIMEMIRASFDRERAEAKQKRLLTGRGIPRNISREAIDHTSTALCQTFYHGYRTGYFDNQDISRYLGIKEKHVARFIEEVARW